MNEEKSIPARQKKKRPKVARQTAPAASSIIDSFPIVGIGASAGGLEALEQFLGHVPKNSGMAFVIVQHLDPTRKGIMPELLQRTTGMKVIQVKDRTTVQPNCVYVIPPNKDMSILHGVLHLLEPAAPRGLRLPIDFFLRSLAQDQQEHSIGVILSGMGSDGTLGLRAIKEKGGRGAGAGPGDGQIRRHAAQRDRRRAGGYCGPGGRSAGQDHRLSAAHSAGPHRPKQALEDKTQSALEKAIILLRTHTGHDFSLYKKNTFYRRIERRMGIHQIDKIADYVRYLQENSQELDLLFKELLIGVTSFFRDPAAGRSCAKRFFPRSSPAVRTAMCCGRGCRAAPPARRPIRWRWCSRRRWRSSSPGRKSRLQVFATDLDKDAIDKARAGRLSGQYLRGCVAGAAEPVLHQGRARLPGDARRSGRW